MPTQPADVAIIVPMLHRAHRVEPLSESIHSSTGATVQVIFVCTRGDIKVIREVERLGFSPEILDPNPVGDYAKKINHGVGICNAPYVFTAADDLDFHRGWFEEAVTFFNYDIGVGVVGTNDLCNPRVMSGLHSTHSLISVAYIEQFGTIDEPGKALHEGYVHEFVDDELVETAKFRRAFAMSRESIVEHLHPMARKAPMDPLYRGQQRRMRKSRSLYQRRKALWTPAG